MSPTPNDLFLAMTTADGSVYTTTRAGNGSWSAFNKVSNLTQARLKNVSVTATYDQQVCAIDNATVRQLRYTKDLTGPTPPVLVARGVAPASAEIASGSLSLAVLGIGPKTPGSRWSFGLPLFQIKRAGTVVPAGDVLGGFDPGVLDPADPALALDVAGTFNDATKDYHLVLATTSGKLYHGYKPNVGQGRFDLRIPDGGTGSCTLAYDGLHVCSALNGKILHAIFYNDGTFRGSGDVMAATGSRETFTRVAIAHYDLPGRTDGILHVAGVTSTGGLFYANRSAENSADPLWTTFVDVKSKAGDKGAVTSVDIAVQP